MAGKGMGCGGSGAVTEAAATIFKKKKKAKITPQPQVEEDRVSFLPVDIILMILSHLPIREAVRASVLSQRWRTLASLLPRLVGFRLDASSILADDHIRLFRSQNTLLGRLHIRKPSSLPEPTITDVLLIAARRGVRELSIDNLKGPSRSIIPTFLLSSKSLAVLSASNCRIQSPDISWVNLRTLKLEKAVLFRGVLDQIVESCVQLDMMNLVFCNVQSVCKIRSSSLKHILIQPATNLLEIDIDTPNLQTLSLYTRPAVVHLAVRAPMVRRAFLHLSKYFPGSKFLLEDFLLAATELSCLTLRGTAVKILAKIMRDRYWFLFTKLRVLSLSLDLVVEDQALFLINLLKHCPQLRELNISFIVAEEESIGFTGRLINSMVEHADRFRQLPCFSDHLKKVELRGSWMHQIEEELVTIVLTEAKVLKKMIIKLTSAPQNQLECKLTDLVKLLSPWGGSIEKPKAFHSTHVIELTLP